MVKEVKKIYVEAVLVCPQCGKRGSLQKPGIDNAIPAGSELVCSACKTVYEIYITLPIVTASEKEGNHVVSSPR